ncbi:putative phosphatidylinositol N-acetylglucosaminyltransferase subunit C [Cyclospora cayetanensis]|uniref:Phosphatidylinositol N-acetylglucosaminyltransferase subunit C n=1 Tax=Cyclospora cayetanensis TaxID=88456 RepID=A0A6P6S1Q3_9EIME|nr:putative phosphatidylinositol N-acetylglucosaminyltransferase subunit C [Cyclospora cayetanensis]
MIVKRSIEASTLVIFDVIALPLGYALRWCLHPWLLKWCANFVSAAPRQVLQSAVIVFGVLRILAPVLQTLTQSFSDDTVISLTSICLLIHIALNDYSYVYRNHGTIDEPLGRLMSLNVALFASVLLASRLSTSTEVFAFLFFGIEIFALSPMARRYLLLWNPWACTYVVTPVLLLLTSALMYIEGSASSVVLYLFLMFFITFIGPYWLIRSQKYKK